jgi:putative transcriptional regulator
MSPGAVRFRLSDILKERGMKQNDLAAKTGLSVNAVSKMTGYVRQVRLDTIARICDVLDVQPGDLLEYVPEKKES